MNVNTLTPKSRAAAAEAIATFLGVLHRLEPSPEVGSLLPREDEPEVALEYFARTEREIVPKLGSLAARALRTQFENYLSTTGNFLFQPVVLHADLGRDHILMDNDLVTAAIDFGDVNWGDPDYDFMYLLVDFGQDFVEEVARRYGHQDLEQLGRKLQYFDVLDQIGTILDGAGMRLEGQEDEAWLRLKQLLRR